MKIEKKISCGLNNLAHGSTNLPFQYSAHQVIQRILINQSERSNA